MTTLAAACWTAKGEGWRTYEQILTLTFESEAQARDAAVTARPLPVGKKVAFSTRWDDSSPEAVAVAKAAVLAEYGYKGTFFLNKVDPAYGENVIRKFLAKGCSAGTYYFAVQCDYADAAGAARLHTTTSQSGQEDVLNGEAKVPEP